MAKSSDKKSKNSSRTPFDSGRLHPVTRHIVLQLDDLDIRNFVTIKGDTTTVTFQIDEDVDLDGFVEVQPPSKTIQ